MLYGKVKYTTELIPISLGPIPVSGIYEYLMNCPGYQPSRYLELPPRPLHPRLRSWDATL